MRALDHAAGVLDPPVAVAGHIHDRAVGKDGGIGRDGSGPDHGPGGGFSNVFEAIFEKAGLLIRQKQEPPVTAASPAVAVGGGLQLNLDRFNPFRRPDGFGQVETALQNEPQQQRCNQKYARTAPLCPPSPF